MIEAAIPDPFVLVERQGGLGIIRLNRPKALNSLTLEMVGLIDGALDALEADDSVGIILLEGAGDRGLCAGGDIRAVAESVRRGDGAAARFFRTEYRLNARIAHLRKPYVAWMDGITMGGGVGLASHGAHRLVTERTRLAMPEVGIGFLPDVGGTWLLSRAPGETGTYLGLTGETVGGADAVAADLADLVVSSADHARIKAALAALETPASGDAVRACLAAFAQGVPPGPVASHRDLIDAAMAADTAEEILAALRADGSDFARAAARTIESKSPTSVKLTLRLIRQARRLPALEPCLEREYAAALAVMGSVDFHEGVRAALVDKDRSPKWQPATLAGVTDEALARYLRPAGDEPIFP